MEQVLITLVAPQALEGQLLEALLEQSSIESFSSSPARGHGAQGPRMSVGEQVAGWRREVRVEVLVDQQRRQEVLQALRGCFRTRSIRYWVSPVLTEGDLGDLPLGH
jgi:hypothetical protein